LLVFTWAAAGCVLLVCAVCVLAVLPVVSRSGLSLLIAACVLLWVVWALRTPPGKIGAINLALLAVLAIAVLATGFSPVPLAAAKGLIKLSSYLGVYALMRQLLASSPLWWDRLVGALLAGELLTSVVGLRQLYGDASALARWSDNNSVAEGTVRIYSSLDNPNLLGGYLLPILPLALVALLRWRGLPRRLFALTALLLGIAALVLTTECLVADKPEKAMGGGASMGTVKSVTEGADEAADEVADEAVASAAAAVTAAGSAARAVSPAVTAGSPAVAAVSPAVSAVSPAVAAVTAAAGKDGRLAGERMQVDVAGSGGGGGGDSDGSASERSQSPERRGRGRPPTAGCGR
jgi:hypothetical protein